MPLDPSNAAPKHNSQSCAALLRAGITAEHDSLLRSIALFISKTERRLHWNEALEMAAEILHEAAQEALRNASRFDPTRSAAAWVRGIAARLLLARRRADALGKRCLPAAVLGEEAWVAAIGQLSIGSADASIALRLDLEQAMALLTPAEQRAIQFRYYQGLDGEDLAIALGVPTLGAARVRVCRALQALRHHFALHEQQALP